MELNEPSGVDTSLTREWVEEVSASGRGRRDVRYVERWEGREVRVVKVVRCVEVPVSSATITLDGSIAPDSGAPTIMGSNGGGIGAEVIFDAKGGTGGAYSECPEDLFVKGPRVAEVEATGASGGECVVALDTAVSSGKEGSCTFCSTGMGGRSGLGGTGGNFVHSSSGYISTSTLSD